jgi:iron complex outermembrane recepter protein
MLSGFSSLASRLTTLIHTSFLLFFALFVVNSSFGQDLKRPNGDKTGTLATEGNATLKGQVLAKEGGAPIEYANVALFRGRDTIALKGVMTDSLGLFAFEQLPYGRFRILISYVGFRPLRYDSIILRPESPFVQLKPISLIGAETVLEGVSIESERAILEIGVEKKTFNVEKNIVSKGGTAADILAQLPSITVEQDGTVNMRGNGNVNILIDGRPSALTGTGKRGAALDQIPADLIEKVEIIANPSARYDPEGVSGIINIVLKKSTVQGTYGTVNVNVGTRDKYNGGFVLSHSWGDLTLSSGYTFRYANNYTRGVSDRKNTFADTSYFFDQLDNGDDLNRTHLANAGLEYKLTPLSILAVNGNLNIRNRSRIEQQGFTYLDQERVETGFSDRRVVTPSEGLGWESGVNFTQNFKTPGRRLFVLANFSTGNNKEAINARQIGINRLTNLPYDYPLEQLNTTRIQSQVITGQLDYIHPLRNTVRLEAGFKTIHRLTDNDLSATDFNHVIARWENNPQISNRFAFTERTYAAYGIYYREWKEFKAQFGLRLERTDVIANQRTTGQYNTYPYWSLFPSLNLSYKIKMGHDLQFNYSRRINRPELDNLNPFIDYSDPLNLRMGNPALRPEFIHSMEGMYVFSSERVTMSASIYYRLTTQQMIRYRTLQDDGAALMTFRNLSTNQSYGSEWILINRWTKKLNSTTSINAYGLNLNDWQLTQRARTGFAYNAKTLINWTIFPRFDAQFSYNYRSEMVIAQGEIKPIHYCDIGLRYSFAKNKWTATANLSDVFDTRQFAIHSVGRGFDQQFVRKRETRILFVGLAYSFGNMKLQPAKPRRGSGGGEGGEGGGGEF